MSRGLGKLQQSILDYLKGRDEGCPAIDISWHIHQQQEGVKEFDPVPHSLHVSVRRAINSLSKRGLLVAVEAGCGLLDAEENKLWCWLPGQAKPEYMNRPKPELKREKVEELILQILQISAEEMITYSNLTSKVAHLLQENSTRSNVAITRAVKSLTEKGLVKTYWKRNGVTGAIGLVKKDSLSVAL